MASASPGPVLAIIREEMDRQSPTASIAPQLRDPKPFQCGYCSVTFDVNVRLVRHVRRHSLTKPFQCGYCQVSYSSNPQLKLHIRTHTLFIGLPRKAAAAGLGEIHPGPATHQPDQNTRSTPSDSSWKSQNTAAEINSFVSSWKQNQDSNSKAVTYLGGSRSKIQKLPSSRFPTDSAATDEDVGDTLHRAVNPDLESDSEDRDCVGNRRDCVENRSDCVENRRDWVENRMQNDFETDPVTSVSSTRRKEHPHAESKSQGVQPPPSGIVNVGLEMMESPFNCVENIKLELAADEKETESQRLDITSVKMEQEHEDIGDCWADQNKMPGDAMATSFSNESMSEGNGMKSAYSQHCKKLVLKGKDGSSRTQKHFQCDICCASFKASRYVGDHKRRVHKIKPAKACRDVADASNSMPAVQTCQQGEQPQGSCAESCQQVTVTRGRSSERQETVLQMEREHPCGQNVVCHSHSRGPAASESETSNLTKILIEAPGDSMASGGILLAASMLSAFDQSLSSVATEKCFACSLCGKVLKTKETLRKHVGIVHSSDRPFPCPQCPTRFKVKQALLDHISFVHRDERRFPCSHCPARYKTKVQLSIHVRSRHSDERPFQCTQCSSRFKQKGHLSEHVFNVHSGERRFPCAHCSLRFKRKIQLTTHVAGVHDNQRPFSCPLCATRFKSKRVLANHVSRVHSSERPHQCSDCGKCFKVKADLSQHWCRPRGCPVCGRLLGCPSTFTSHVRTHSQENTAQCSVCSKAFRTRRLLEIHTRTHTKEKRYTCEVCGQSFSLVNTFTYHRNRHLAVRPYSCHTCQKGFNSHQGLWQHKRRHLGDKRYACDRCQKMFYNSSSLKRHTLTHTDLRPLSCSVCGKTYRRRSTLKYHLQHFHQLQVVNVQGE